jgi:hypothetical protein
MDGDCKKWYFKGCILKKSNVGLSFDPILPWGPQKLPISCLNLTEGITPSIKLSQPSTKGATVTDRGGKFLCQSQYFLGINLNSARTPASPGHNADENKTALLKKGGEKQ